MHRTEPGLDWRAKDEETRGRKVARRLLERTEMKAAGILTEGAAITERPGWYFDPRSADHQLYLVM